MFDEYLSFEPNGSFELSAAIGAGTYSIDSVGRDFYSVQGAPGLMTFSMTPEPGLDVNMILYNSQKQVVGGNFASGNETIQYRSSSSETYYLEIFPTATSASRYELDVALPEKTWATTLDFGPIRDVSVALYDIDADGKDEIFIGTSKSLDGNLNEVRPAGLIVLEDDGTIKWSVSFPAIAGPDPQTGKTYQTTSVSTAPAFSDINGDGSIDILVGVGADVYGEAGGNVVGQPGDKGGVYALNADGSIIWFHQSLDTIGGTSNTGDGRPDGVYGSPVVFDIDRDGQREVIVNGWDQSTTILDARTGAVERNIHLADTIWSTPRIADLNGDNIFEILVSADITTNADAGVSTGGIFHVLSADGSQRTPGFDQPVGNPNYTELRGKYEEQVLWSSPVTGDIDGDGLLEIAYGTGNYFADARGSYIKVWEHDGALKYQLATRGKTFATPLIVDLDGNGDMEIIAATLDGYVHAWDHLGRELFVSRPTTIGGAQGNPIFGAPLAIDLNGDDALEIIFSQGAQTVILDHSGKQLTASESREYVFESFKGSPAVRDIDGDSQLEIISGGTTAAKDQAVVYRWDAPGEQAGEVADARYQFHQSQSNIEAFVKRFYQTVLERDAEPAGRNDWVDRLASGVEAGADVARGFVFSTEFTNRQLDDQNFVSVLYRAFFNRDPDQAGMNDWLQRLGAGTDRGSILDGFIYSQEFKNLATAYSILPAK
ncbi:DUF4214 domain-containing protein [Marinobacter sp.]|uniref:DUF4214 domain-containing protein n=1 Tax=Marinobacter sp. TaxID=50741 RepID=UPI003A8D77E2